MVPSYDLLAKYYPDHIGMQAVKVMIGGHVNQPDVTDTCAVRMSRALNYSGMPLPHNKRGLLTVSGADHLWYAIRMQELKAWLYQKLGPPDIVAAKPKIKRELFAESKGIVAFDITFGLNPDGRTRALGHLDLWDGTAYTHEAEDTRDYFLLATKVVLWKAP